MTRIYNGERDLSQIAYITAATLPELENKVNEKVADFLSQSEKDPHENVHHSADIYSNLKFINGEYVQVVQFTSFKRMQIIGKRRPAKKKATKKTTASNPTA